MPYPADYITIDRSTPSRSGLYATGLPGVEIGMLESLTKEDQDDYEEFFEMILENAWSTLITDVSIALQGKFYVDAKLVSRETSEFQTSLNSNTGLSGILIEFNLPKYARIHVISVGLKSEQAYDSPEATIQFYEENADGELLYEKDAGIEVGRNTVNIDRDFEVDKLFVAYDPEQLDFKGTENKFYASGYTHWDKLTCIWPCAGGLYEGSVRQINGGGLNVKYVIYCSIEKFVQENINFFKKAFWYRIGVELTDEVILGNKLNKYCTLTDERKTERNGYFGTKYTANLTEAIKAHNVREDPVCFICKNTVTSKSNLP